MEMYVKFETRDSQTNWQLLKATTILGAKREINFLDESIKYPVVTIGNRQNGFGLIRTHATKRKNKWYEAHSNGMGVTILR